VVLEATVEVRHDEEGVDEANGEPAKEGVRERKGKRKRGEEVKVKDGRYGRYGRREGYGRKDVEGNEEDAERTIRDEGVHAGGVL